jgi:predicted membrane protein
MRAEEYYFLSIIFFFGRVIINSFKIMWVWIFLTIKLIVYYFRPNFQNTKDPFDDIC